MSRSPSQSKKPLDGEEERERRGGDRVQLLADVQAALGVPAAQPAVVTIEVLHLAHRAPQRAAIADARTTSTSAIAQAIAVQR